MAQQWAEDRRGDARYVRYRIFAERIPGLQRTVAWYDAHGHLTELHHLESAPRGGWVIGTMAGCAG